MPAKTHGHASGRTHSRAYSAWHQMKARCQNTNCSAYKDYGARGIGFCERWRRFELFLEDMGEPPLSTSLDRKDNNGGYCKENCQWADDKAQQNNKRDNVSLEFDGKRLTVSQWAERLGIKVNTLQYRLLRGWDVERALTVQVQSRSIA